MDGKEYYLNAPAGALTHVCLYQPYSGPAGAPPKYGLGVAESLLETLEGALDGVYPLPHDVRYLKNLSRPLVSVCRLLSGGTFERLDTKDSARVLTRARELSAAINRPDLPMDKFRTVLRLRRVAISHPKLPPGVTHDLRLEEVLVDLQSIESVLGVGLDAGLSENAKP